MKQWNTAVTAMRYKLSQILKLLKGNGFFKSSGKGGISRPILGNLFRILRWSNKWFKNL